MPLTRFAALALATMLPSIAAARDPHAIINDLVRLQGEYRLCLQQQIVELGAANAETADTLVRAASAVCRTKEAELRTAYAESPLPQAHVQGLMDRDRKAGEESGVAALLQERATRAK
jgi:hypothetical protein